MPNIKMLAATCAMAAFAGLGVLTAPADIITEVGDASDTLAGATTSSSLGGATITAIVGTVASTHDADVYLIYINNPAAFSASTVNGSTAFDSQLWLFNAAGRPVFMNDDASGTTLQSALPALPGGNNAGFYYLAISPSGYDAANAVNQLLFGFTTNPTDVRGPQLGAGGPLGAWVDSGSAFGTGGYQIDVNGVVVVPEPATVAAGAGATLAALTVLVPRLRRRRQG